MGAGDESRPDDGIDDPEALRRAEEAVAHDRPLPDTVRAPIDEEWTKVATHDGAGGTAGLEVVAGALRDAGVPVGWDPFEPSEMVGFVPPGASLRAYALQVPVSQVARAHEVLGDSAPQGVTYSWGPVTAVRAPSDNERLERIAGGGPSALAIAVATGVLLVVVALVFYLVQRG
jgi:hypothetical protein